MTDAALTPADGTPLAIAVSFQTNISVDPIQDEVRFFCWDPDEMMWMQCGDTQVEPNPTNLPLFSSTTEVQIGAVGGTTLNAAGLFRMVSIRQGTGEGDLLGGVEYARMRGDITANPSYDRYGNLWSNQGAGWSYVDMVNPPDPQMLLVQ